MREITIYTDGSGTHVADGPACIGVVLLVDGEIVCEASEHVGTGTNNVAELRAIRRGLFLAEQLGEIEDALTEPPNAARRFLQKRAADGAAA